MANYASSLLVNAQAKLNRKYNEAELRRKDRPVLGLAVANQDYAIPGHQELRKSESRPVDVKYLLKRAAGAGTAKAATHTGSKGDSGTLTLSWNTITETFRLSRKQAQNNVFGFQEMFNYELEQAISNLKDRAETLAVTALVGNRVSLAAPTTGGAGTWDNTANKSLGIAAGDAAYFALRTKQYLQARYFKPEYDMIADLKLFHNLQIPLNQGGGNATNQAFQFAGFNIVPSQDTLIAALTGGVGIAMPKGSFAGLVWNDPMNRAGIDTGDNNVGMFNTLLDPFGSGITFDVSKYTARVDESASGGGVQDVKDEWEISMQIGWAVPPISVAGDSAIHAVHQL